MKPERLAEIRARLSAATPGPWHVGHIHEDSDCADIEDQHGCIVAELSLRRDEGLICNAPTDICDLLATVDRLTEMLFQMQNAAIDLAQKNARLEKVAEAANAIPYALSIDGSEAETDRAIARMRKILNDAKK